MGLPVCECISETWKQVCSSILLTESLCCLQSLRSWVCHIETLDSHAAFLHQFFALVLLQIQPSSGTHRGALWKRWQRMNEADFRSKHSFNTGVRVLRLQMSILKELYMTQCSPKYLDASPRQKMLFYSTVMSFNLDFLYYTPGKMPLLHAYIILAISLCLYTVSVCTRFLLIKPFS